ncbi:SDR family oxidoreductase [Pleurocapsales cyanobacterium LEGE 06147]|nr:SDR family oxidoreductase [Pleurocapsales cyanobacterium LEGE 06147]
MKIAIVGCGYVGTALARLWHKMGHEITVTTTTSEKVSNLQEIAQRVVIVQGDDLNNLKEVVKDQEIVVLSVGARNRGTYRQTYLETAKNLVLALKEAPNVHQLIYTGSYAVLGDKRGAWVDEQSPVTPANENGEILSQTERALLSAQNEELKVYILRLAGIYGPGRELIKIFRSWAGTTRPGDGKDYTNWIHLDDIVNAINLASQKQLQGIYHLGSDEILPRHEFFDRLFQTHQLPSVTWDASMTSTRPYNVKLSNRKIKAAGFELVHPKILF